MTFYDRFDNLQGIHFGNRDTVFKNFITSLLEKSQLKPKYIAKLTDENSMKIYASAFTSELVDPENNYQVLEQLGDLSGNKFIVGYMYRRFPQLKCTSGVKVVARLRINYGAKQSFSEIARNLGFWQFISAPHDIRQRKMKPLLEDVFEAFIGATESILDDRVKMGVGYAIVYEILAGIFDEMTISLRYEDLYDAKTRIKELFDLHEEKLGPLVYKDNKIEMKNRTDVFRVDGGHYQERPNGTINKKIIVGGKYVKIGEGCASLKADAQQAAAADALRTLNAQGWSKPIPSVYRKFNRNEKIEKKIKITKEYVTETYPEIDELYSTKTKSKYQNKYESTALAMYSRLRDRSGIKSCIKLGADPNIKDTDGMSPLDLLFIGKVDEKKVGKLMKYLIDAGAEKKMRKEVYNMYYMSYIQDYIADMEIEKYE